MEETKPRKSTVMVRQLEPEVVRKLKVKAARNGRSMEAELREVLSTVASQVAE